jgi:hypothetical protein
MCWHGARCFTSYMTAKEPLLSEYLPICRSAAVCAASLSMCTRSSVFMKPVITSYSIAAHFSFSHMSPIKCKCNEQLINIMNLLQLMIKAYLVVIDNVVVEFWIQHVFIAMQISVQHVASTAHQILDCPKPLSRQSRKVLCMLMELPALQL